MQVEVSFSDIDDERNEDWEPFIRESAKTAAAVLSDDDFIARVGSWRAFDATKDSPKQVADKIRGAGVLKIRVAFYHRRIGPAIAKEIGGKIHINTAKRAYGAGSPANIAHEVMHVLGFKHDGNRPSGNDNTVPYRIGEWVDDALRSGSNAYDDTE
jgi:hypothetical protein